MVPASICLDAASSTRVSLVVLLVTKCLSTNRMTAMRVKECLFVLMRLFDRLPFECYGFSVPSPVRKQQQLWLLLGSRLLLAPKSYDKSELYRLVVLIG